MLMPNDENLSIATVYLKCLTILNMALECLTFCYNDITYLFKYYTIIAAIDITYRP